MPIKRGDGRQRDVVRFVMKPGGAGCMSASRVEAFYRSASPLSNLVLYTSLFVAQKLGGKSKGQIFHYHI